MEDIHAGLLAAHRLIIPSVGRGKVKVGAVWLPVSWGEKTVSFWPSIPRSSPWLKMPGYPMAPGRICASQEIDPMSSIFSSFPTSASTIPTSPDLRALDLSCPQQSGEPAPRETMTVDHKHPGHGLRQLLPWQVPLPICSKLAKAKQAQWGRGLHTHRELHRCSKVAPSPGEEEGDWAISPTLRLILEEEGGQHEHLGSSILCLPQYRGRSWTGLAMTVHGNPRAAAKLSTHAAPLLLLPSLPFSSSLPPPPAQAACPLVQEVRLGQIWL